MCRRPIACLGFCMHCTTETPLAHLNSPDIAVALCSSSVPCCLVPTDSSIFHPRHSCADLHESLSPVTVLSTHSRHSPARCTTSCNEPSAAHLDLPVYFPDTPSASSRELSVFSDPATAILPLDLLFRTPIALTGSTA